MKQIVAADGAVVTSGQVLAVLEPGEIGAAAPATSASAAPNPPGPGSETRAGAGCARRAAACARIAARRAAAHRAPPPRRQPPRRARATAAAPAGRSADKIGPAVRKLVEEHDLDPTSIAGSGREGRITKGDVLDYIADHQATTVGIDHGVLDRAGLPPQPQPSSGPRGRPEQRVAMTRLRARIAERLLQAQSSAAMLTTFNECDMTAIMALRQKYQEPFQAKHGIKLGFMSFFVKACIEGLRQFPLLNASVDGNDIVYHEFFDVGVAVSTDRGLIVPVLRNAEQLGLGEIENAIRGLRRARPHGGLTMEELTGGTFTITNGGIFGSLMSTPILNPPQSGILGHA